MTEITWEHTMNTKVGIFSSAKESLKVTHTALTYEIKRKTAEIDRQNPNVGRRQVGKKQKIINNDLQKLRSKGES